MANRSSHGVYRSALKRWGVPRTLAISAAGLVTAGLTLALAISGVTRTTNPQLALRFVPGESRALVSRASELLVEHPLDNITEVKRLATASLKHQALNPRALSVLGYVATAERNETRARMLIRLSESQSRRDMGAQLWLIEDWVQRGGVEQALKHYDTVLRTHPSVYTTLFPILLQALGDPNIRIALSPYIRKADTWAQHFLTHAIANSSDLPALVALLVRSGGLKDPNAARVQTLALLQRLISEKKFLDARQLYLGTRDINATRLTSTAFLAADGTTPVDPMGWQVTSVAEAGGGFIKGNDGRPVLSVFANVATVATVASKLLYLPPGNYRFTATLSRIETGDGGRLTWQLRCPTPEGDQQIWSLESTSRSPQASLAIPRACTVQYLDLVIAGGSGADGLNATVDLISLRTTG